MKKILTVLLVAAMVLGAVLASTVSVSAARVNEQIDVKFIKKAPVQDGVISRKEYGDVIISYKPGDDYDGVIHDHDEYGDWGFDFYAAWDFDYLYLAWQVNSTVHGELPADVAKEDDSGLGNMWEYSCVQFIITPGEPKSDVIKYQTGQWNGNYMEGGVALVEGNTRKILWSLFEGATTTANDWDATAVHNSDNTVYEVRLPWKKSGVPAVGNDQKFGLTFGDDYVAIED